MPEASTTETATASVDWASVRSEFRALARWTYLNTATFGQLPRRTVEAVKRHFERRDEFACSDFMSWFEDADTLRGSIARLINAEPADIAFVPNACTGLAILLNGIEWRPGDRIVTFEHEFPNNVYYPARLAERGVEFVETSWERFEKAVTPRTRAVVMSEVNYTNGFRPPLAEIARYVHGRGALLYVDGTQSLGALQVDVRASDVDVYAVHGYKWLISPNGAGFMFVRPSVREWLNPMVIGWRTHRTWREVHNLWNGSPEFSPDAERYEGGVLPFAPLYGMKASVDMLLEIGPAAIEARVLALAAHLREVLRGLGARLVCDEGPHFGSPIVAASFPGRSGSEICARLRASNVLISERLGNLRISTHFYNNEEDIERLAAVLRGCCV